MLRHLGSGERMFGLHPLDCHRRANWEFYAVVQGRIGPLLRGENDPPLESLHLWVFAPEFAHGWRGDDEAAHIIFFHFRATPAPLYSLGRDAGVHGVALSAADARSIVSLEEELKPHYEHPTSFSNIYFDYALRRLSLLALRNLTPQFLETSNAAVRRKVDAAVDWYSEHLAQRPKIMETAAAVHVSASHLRRLFWEVYQESPERLFTRLKMQRAMRVMVETDMKLEALALSCGFSSASDFCRAFKQQHKMAPDLWRRAFKGHQDESQE